MNISFANGVLKVVTDVTKETIEKGISDLVARDEKHNEIYRVVMSKNGNGSVDANGIVCNTYVDGKAALVLVLGPEATQESVQKKYGEALLIANAHVSEIAAAAIEKEETIAGLFQ
jgi:hypothetical protein